MNKIVRKCSQHLFNKGLNETILTILLAVSIMSWTFILLLCLVLATSDDTVCLKC